MTEAIHRASGGQRLWVAARFVIFGIGGLWLMLVCWVSLLDVGIQPERWRWVSPLLLLPGGFAGALSILFGVGEWRRWAYLWVFVSMPIGALVMTLANSKEMGVVALATPMVTSYALVRLYYQRRDARQAQLSPRPEADVQQNAGSQ